MEKLLLKLARQLDALDEASLMGLWSKYATLTTRFEPTKRWEDACLVFSLIQAKRWKNQLFNYSWSQQRLPPIKGGPLPAMEGASQNFNLEQPVAESTPDNGACRVLAFRPFTHPDKTPSDTEDE